MCGICGKISRPGEKTNETLLRKMCNVITHRGPDDEGLFIRENVGLGVRRLSIIDIKGGSQPMFNEDKKICVVYNGEIFNFKEERKKLIQKGHHFKTNSDTEIIVHLYEEVGIDCISHLRGMFAFALWDQNRKELYLVRDRFGIKPLHYCINNGALLFGSEIKSILQEHKVSREINFRALNDYFTFMYIPGPETIFKDIYKLDPAHYLIYKEGKIKIEQYWDFPKTKISNLSEEEYCLELMTRLKESIKLSTISDVPLGVFLSGGIDSSLMVALLSEISTQTIKTFSIGFGKEKNYNELEYARSVSKQFHTDHYEYNVEPKVIDILPHLVSCFDEPFADASAIPTYYVSKMASKKIKVALSGEGGDEIFAGYPNRYYWDQKAEYLQNIPIGFKNGQLSNFMALLPMPRNRYLQNKIRQLKKFTYYGSLPQPERYTNWFSIFTSELKTKLYTKDLMANIEDLESYRIYAKHFALRKNDHPLNKMLYVDSKVLLPGDLLTKTDRTSMANSLEVRVPFLDHKLVEYAWNLPPSMKLKGKTTKYILRKLAARLLPQNIVKRKKQGFEVPISSWFQGNLNAFAKEILSPEIIKRRNLFNPDAIKGIIDKVDNGIAHYAPHLYALIVFEIWSQSYIDKNVVICEHTALSDTSKTTVD